MTGPYEDKVKDVSDKQKGRPESAAKYSGHKESLIKFAGIFFAVMVVGTICVSALLLMK